MWVEQTKLKSLINLRVHVQKLVDQWNIYKHKNQTRPHSKISSKLNKESGSSGGAWCCIPFRCISPMNNIMCAGTQVCENYTNYIYVMHRTHQGTLVISVGTIRSCHFTLNCTHLSGALLRNYASYETLLLYGNKYISHSILF